MHPEVWSDHPDRCPLCGMKLVSAQRIGEAADSEHHHEHPGEEDDEHQHGHANGEHAHEATGIEWEDDMVEVNRMTTPGQHALEAGRPGNGCRGLGNRLALPASATG